MLRLRDRFSLPVVAFGVALGLLVSACGDDDGTQHLSSPRDVFFENRTLNIAHRGGARLWPEHTLLAYERAKEVGADVVELDLHATVDGVIVPIHDATVDRTTDGTGEVRQMNYAEIAALDAGYRFTRDGGTTYPWRGMGLKVPTLDEALDLLGDTPLSVEIKQSIPPIAAEVVAVFEAHGALENAIFVSFDRRPVESIRQLRPNALTAFSAGEIVTFGLLDEGSLPGYMAPAPFIQPPAELVDSAFVARANALDLKIHAWTVNSTAEMNRLIGLGVGGIFTDDPVKLEEVLAGSS
jgi:glycerophosphoryl diester phosphodiesterase